ncbi:MAG: hypothetical protein GY711_09825 [bacterium]|nr:hypothetical protein [bacterium]
MIRLSNIVGGAFALALLGVPALGQDLTNQDECSQAQLDVRVGDGSFGWDNSGATTGADGQAEASCYSFGTDDIASDIWFVWEATVDGTVDMSTCASAGNTDTKLAAYPGDCCPADGTSLACNDDACSTLSQISFAVACGESYMIQIGSFPGSSDGAGVIDVAQTGSPCGGTTAWTQSTVNNVITTGVVCVAGESSAWRLYDPATQGVAGDFEIIDVTFAIREATSVSGTQMATVRVRDGSGFPTIANMPILDEVDFIVVDQLNTFMTVPVSTGLIPAGTPIAIELVSLNLAGTNVLIPGFNLLGQTAPNYISTPVECGPVLDPTDMDVFQPGRHLILDCTSLEAPAPPDDSIGCNYCNPAVPNTTGNPGTIAANGSTDLGDNDVTLTASDPPLDPFGCFLAGPGPGTFVPPSSDGIFCLLGGNSEHLGRYDGDTFDTGVTGTGSLVIDVDAVPIAGDNVGTPGPFERALLSGETWNFQCWYRDSGSNNFTDAIAILFQ